ncbi:MAG: dicarboxylate/amino acid:cation symporter [Bacteroidetes bacterium]|nr:dicarboxylate/amino acid:cation symporter [Bacteroidota bacterium]
MSKFPKLKLHWKILIGMILGAVVGVIANEMGFAWVVSSYIKPVGSLFIRLISMTAVPLVLASLIVGVASMKDLKKLSRIGSKTMAFYIATTMVAITIGLVLANLIRPGEGLDEKVKEQLRSDYSGIVDSKISKTAEVSITQQILDIVPLNPFNSLATERGEMLQIVFFALLLGIALNMVLPEKSQPVIRFFDGLTDAMIKIIEMVMKIAPYGVFALIAAVIADFGFEILQPLGKYFFAVILGLFLHVAIVYAPMIAFLSKLTVKKFFKALSEVQLVAFSSSSSAATLAVNMDVCQKKLGIKEEVTGFVLPLGATINMDGTALYQGVAAVFIAQVYGIPLHWTEQLTIILTATLASIGTAAVPGVGMIMLVIVLQSVHIPPEGIALIFGVDRVLDMLRTTVNVTGDAVVASVIATQEDLFENQPGENVSA